MTMLLERLKKNMVNRVAFYLAILTLYLLAFSECSLEVETSSLEGALTQAVSDLRTGVNKVSVSTSKIYTETMAEQLDDFLTPKPWLQLVTEPTLGFSGTIEMALYSVEPEFAPFFNTLQTTQFGPSACSEAVFFHRQNSGRYLGSLSGTWFKSFSAAVRQGATFVPLIDPAHPLFGENGLSSSFLPAFRTSGECARPRVQRLMQLGTELFPLSQWADFSGRASMTPSRLERLAKTNEWTLCLCGNLSTFNCSDAMCHTSLAMPVDSKTKKRQDEELVISRKGACVIVVP